MKILYIVPAYLPAYRYGGPIKSDHYRNKWLVKKGVEVSVYTTDIDGPNSLKVPLGTPVDVDGVRVFYFKGSFPRAWFYSRDLHRALKENIKDFDMVHITSVFLSASALGAYYAKKFNKPYIISPRGSLMKEPLALKSHIKKKFYIALLENNNLRDATAIHFTAPIEEEEYKAQGLPLRQGIVIPNSFDEDDFKEVQDTRPEVFRDKFNIGKDIKIILFLSRISWKKGLDTLIPALSLIIKKEPKALLVIAGGDDEGYKKKVEELINKHGLRSSVVFTGMLLGRDLVAAYKSSSVFVLPSYSENFAMSVVEAMYFRVPVVVTKHVGVAPSVQNSVAGIVIEKNESELSESILNILQNPEKSREMGERGRLSVLKEFSAPSVADQFLAAYNKLVN
ncbi:MAG: glycosyltransferase [Patescibacteria group bacterium]